VEVDQQPTVVPRCSGLVAVQMGNSLDFAQWAEVVSRIFFSHADE
jgi:hypothetical protein